MYLSQDTDLIKRLQKGDVEAFDLLYHRYSGKLFFFGMKYLKSPDEAEELVQSVFMKVWETHHRVNKDLSLKSYLFTIAYNDICKLFRSRYHLQKYVEETLNNNSAISSEPEESLDYKSVLEQIINVIEKLPEKQKLAFLKSKVEGKPAKEIASDLGLSVGTIDNYVSETVKFLRISVNKNNLPLLLFCSLFLF